MVGYTKKAKIKYKRLILDLQLGQLFTALKETQRPTEVIIVEISVLAHLERPRVLVAIEGLCFSCGVLLEINK